MEILRYRDVFDGKRSFPATKSTFSHRTQFFWARAARGLPINRQAIDDGGPLGKGAVGESRREWRRRQQSCAQERESLGAQGPPPHAAGQERERQVHLYGNGGWIAALSGTSRASPSLLALRLLGPIPRLGWGGPRAPLRGPRARLGIPRTARSSLRRTLSLTSSGSRA